LFFFYTVLLPSIPPFPFPSSIWPSGQLTHTGHWPWVLQNYYKAARTELIV